MTKQIYCGIQKTPVSLTSRDFAVNWDVACEKLSIHLFRLLLPEIRVCHGCNGSGVSCDFIDHEDEPTANDDVCMMCSGTGAVLVDELGKKLSYVSLGEGFYCQAESYYQLCTMVTAMSPTFLSDFEVLSEKLWRVVIDGSGLARFEHYDQVAWVGFNLKVTQRDTPDVYWDVAAQKVVITTFNADGFEIVSGMPFGMREVA